MKAQGALHSEQMRQQPMQRQEESSVATILSRKRSMSGAGGTIDVRMIEPFGGNGDSRTTGRYKVG